MMAKQGRGASSNASITRFTQGHLCQAKHARRFYWSPIGAHSGRMAKELLTGRTLWNGIDDSHTTSELLMIGDPSLDPFLDFGGKVVVLGVLGVLEHDVGQRELNRCAMDYRG